MNLIDLKERVAISTDFTPGERNFILDAINATPAARVDSAIAHDPGNYMGRIDHLWAYLSVDDGGEGVCAAPLQQGMLSIPMIAADKTRLDQLRPLAGQIARRFNRVIRLAKFTKREDVEIIRP